MAHIHVENETGLFLTGKRIFPEKSLMLYDRPIDSHTLEDFEVASGEWEASNDGWLTGQIRKNGGGILYSRQSYPGDIVLEFDAMAVPPCDNDLNFVWKASGWDYARNDAGKGFIGGLGGWWLNRAGIEKYPSCIPFVATGLCPLEAGRLIHIAAGSVENHAFIFADGRLVVELKDPAPELLDDCGRFGLGTYASRIQFANLKVYRPYWEPTHVRYPEPDWE